jgi:hypothetical protein
MTTKTVGRGKAVLGDATRSRAHGSLCVVLVRLRVAKVNQDPIAHVFRHEATEALHRLRDALLIGRNYLAQVFRVHAG